MAGKLVSIVIINMNGKKHVERCFAAIKKNTAYPNYEIAVVDNGSSDGSVELFKELKAKGVIKTLILNKENVGAPEAANQAFRASKGAYMYKLDNDALVEKGWLLKVVEALENYPKKVGAVGSTLVPENDYGKGLRGKETVKERQAACGCAMLYNGEAVKRVGLFDAKRLSPIYGEENDWGYRARRLGYVILTTNASRVYHVGGSDTTRSSNARARFVLLETHRMKVMLYNLTLPEFLRHVPGLGMIFINSILEFKLHWLLKSYWNTLANLGEIIAERKRRGVPII